VVIEKWTKAIFQLFEGLRFECREEVLKTNMFYLATTCLKGNYFLTEATMSMVPPLRDRTYGW
jgi:hypothetical protein